MGTVGSFVHVRGVGRARELATIAFARDSARTGHGSVLVVSGEAGIGKTWLCRAAGDGAQQEGFATGWGAGWPDGAAPPLWPWHQALREAFGADLAPLLDALPVDPDDPAWFPAGVELVDELRRRTATTPALVVLDDLHAADAASIRLAWFLARHLRNLHLLVIVAHRSDDATSGPDASADGLAGVGREGTPLPLVGLAPEEVASILRTEGRVELAEADIAFVLRTSGGRPSEIGRLTAAATDPAHRADPRHAVLQAVVAPRIDALDPGVRHAAATAALVARSVSWTDLAGVARSGGPSPAAVVAALHGQGLATATGPTEVTFSHDHVVEALAATMAPSEVVDAHARAAAHLGGAAPSAAERRARRAHHALEAAARSPEDARLAVAAAVEAAGALAAGNDQNRAAGLLARAAAVHEAEGMGEPPASLQAAHATAVLRAGRLADSRVLFERAAAAAEQEDDAVSLAVAALGLGGIWVSEHRSTIDSGRILGLQHRALRRLPEDEVALRCRLRVRLAAEAAYAAGPAQHLSDDLAAALDDARALGDPVVLAESLSLYHHLLLGPDEAVERLGVAREVIAAATAGGDALLSLVGLCWLTVDLFLAGHPGAERSLRELHVGADAIGCRSVGFVADVIDVMVLLRAGRIEDAEAASAAAFETGVEVGDADALAWYGVQLVVIRWLQGRSREVLDLAAETGTSPTLTRANNAFLSVVANLAATCGEDDRARTALAQLQAQGLEVIRHSSVWMATLFSIGEAASTLGDTDLLEDVGTLLEPFAHLPMLGSMAVVCLGSPHRTLGLVALGLGEVERAVDRFEAAVGENDRLGNRPFAARCRADLARALLERGHTGDRARAADALDHAIREGTAMGLTAWVETWRDRRAALDVATTPTRPADTVDRDTGVIRRRGSSWILVTATAEVVTPDLLGMAYLAKLLLRPGREVSSVDLAAGVDHEALWARQQPVLDQQALAAYRDRVSALEQELDEAERYADPERASRARAELDEVVDELGRSTDLHGRARPFDSQAERTRTAVRKAVRRALDHIEAVDPLLGAALRRSVQTGRACCYRPGPGAPTHWIED